MKYDEIHLAIDGSKTEKFRSKIVVCKLQNELDEGVSWSDDFFSDWDQKWII